MKIGMRILAVLASAAASGCIGTLETPRTPDDEIEYQGERIKLTKAYSDYDDYKEDPNNIDLSELPRVEKLVCSAPIASSFADRWQMLQAISSLAFPGYGHWQFGDKAQADGSVLSGFGIEVPHSDKARILVFRAEGSGFTLIDDFVGPSDPSIEKEIVTVTLADGKLVYSDFEKRPVLTRDLRDSTR